MRQKTVKVFVAQKTVLPVEKYAFAKHYWYNIILQVEMISILWHKITILIDHRHK